MPPRKPRPHLQRFANQSEELTEQMDTFTAAIFDVLQENKTGFLSYLSSYLVEHGEQLINRRDSTGNCMIHNICMSLQDNQEDQKILEEVLIFLLQSATDDKEQKKEEMTVKNFMRGLPISMMLKNQTLSDLGFDTLQQKQLREIFKVNPGNAFGQTPLHLLASQKKVKLLLKYLEVVHDFTQAKEEQTSSTFAHTLVGFNPNESETTHRSFMQVLLERGEIETFEIIAKKYIGSVNIEGRDMFQNSTLMLYKTLKRQQLHYLKSTQNPNYADYITCLMNSDLQAFGDLRNLLFDRDLGTNILTELVTGKPFDTDKLLDLSMQLRIRVEPQLPGIMEALTNVPNQQGDTIGQKILSKLKYNDIEKYFEIVGGHQKLTTTVNNNTKSNVAHWIMSNSTLSSQQMDRLLEDFRCDPDLFNRADREGNLPLNTLIEQMSRKNQIDQHDIMFFTKIMNKTDLKCFNDLEHQNQRKEQEQRFKQEIDELRVKRAEHEKHEEAQKPKKKVNRPVKEIKTTFKNKYPVKKQLLDKHNQLIAAGNLPVNPLETAIKSNAPQELVKILINDGKLSPMSQSSQGTTSSLLEISIQTSIQLFQTIINEMKSGYKVLTKPITTVLKLQREQQTSSGQLTLSKIPLIEKILGTGQEQLKEALMLELNNDQYGMTFLSKVQVKEFLLSLKSQQNQIGQFTHMSQMFIQAVRVESYELISSLKVFLNFSDTETQDYFLYRMLKEVLSRNNKQGLDNLIQTLPEIKQINISEEQKKKLAKAMFIKFKNIINPDCIQSIKSQIGLTLIPNLSSEGLSVYNRKAQRDYHFQQLSRSYQNDLINSLQVSAFNYIIDLLKNTDNSNLSELNEAVDAYLQGKNKTLFLQQLVQNNALFTVLDPRRDSQQQTLGRFLSLQLKQGKFTIALQLLSQLKDYLVTNCSVYPADYHAELMQFERNYPYREFKIDNFIRKMNLKGDRYPIFFGQFDYGEITDDQEEYMQKVWDEMLKTKGQVETEKFGPYPVNYSDPQMKVKDSFVPNGNVMLFQMFSFLQPVQIKVTQQNFNEVQELIKYVFEFGGFPMISFDINFQWPNQMRQQYHSYYLKLNKTLSNFNQCIHSGKFQTLLHQLSLDQDCDTTLLSQLSSDQSLQRQNFNSMDSQGKTPITLAIEYQNTKFLSCLINSSNVFIKDDEQLSKILQHSFNQDTSFEWKISLLKFIATNVSKQDKHGQELMLKSTKRNITDMIDMIYSTQTEEENDTYVPNSVNQIISLLGVNKQIFIDHNESILEIYKLMRIQMQKLSLAQQIVFGKMISPTFQLGKLVVQLASEATLDQIKELESLGFKISNCLSMTFGKANLASQAISRPKQRTGLQKQTKQAAASQVRIPEYFPFEKADYYISYALKYALQNQPQNRQLVDYLYQNIDISTCKAILFEVLILIGKAYGTKDPIFTELFTKHKAHLMGRYLTVETRIKNFSNSLMPCLAMQYYGEKAYNTMLVTLQDLLIENNELAYFTTYINDQAKFYICKEMIIKGLESSCRYFRPKMALLLFSLCSEEQLEYNFVDYSNMMPNLKSVVTMKDVHQTAQVMRCLNDKFSPTTVFSKLSRELVDEYLLHMLEQNKLHLVFPTFSDKDKSWDYVRTFTPIFEKLSPDVIPQLVKGLYNLCQNQTERHNMLLLLFELLSKCASGEYGYSTHHKNKRKMQIKSYLTSKLDRLAQEPSYYKLIADETQINRLSQVLGLEINEWKEFRNKVIQVKASNDKLENKTFVYGDLQTLYGVFNANKDRPARNEQASCVGVMQRFSIEEVKNMTRDDLVKSQSENLIILWEHLQQQEHRRKYPGINHGRVGSTEPGQGIKDYELRHMMLNARPYSINLECLFTDDDSAITNNILEEQVTELKIKAVLASIDITEFQQDRSLYLELMNKLKDCSYYHSEAKLYHLPCLDFYLNQFPKLQSMIISDYFEYKNNQVPEEDKKENNDDNDYGNDDDATNDYVNELRQMRDTLQDYFYRQLGKVSNEYRLQEIMKRVKNYLDMIDFQFLKMDLTNDDQKSLIVEIATKLFIKYPQCYKECGQPFLMNLIQNFSTQFSYLLEDIDPRIKDKPVKLHNLQMMIALPIFNSTLNDDNDQKLRHMLLTNDIFMSASTSWLKKMIFALLVCNTNTKVTDKNLLQLLPWFEEIDDISEVNVQQEGLSRYEVQFKFREPAGNSSHPVIYLIKNKRLDVVQEYAEKFDTISKEIVLALIANMTPSNQQHIQLLKWFIVRAQIDLSENLTLVKEVLVQPNGFELLEVLQKEFESQGNLFDSYIEYMTTSEAALSTEEEVSGNEEVVSLLHELIRTQNYRAVLAVKKYCTEQQWQYFKNFKAYIMEFRPNIREGEESQQEEEDVKAAELISIVENKRNLKIVRPFFLSLVYSQFELCEILMLDKKDIVDGSLTYREMKTFEEFLNGFQANSFRTCNLSHKEDPMLGQLQELAYQSNIIMSSDNIHVGQYPTFQFVKCMLSCPEILLFIYFLPEKFGINLKTIANGKAVSDMHFNHQIDSFLVKCGFFPSLENFVKKVLTPQQPSAFLYNVENALDMLDFLNSEGLSPPVEPRISKLLQSPYTFLTEAKSIKSPLRVVKTSIFDSPRLTSILQSEEIQQTTKSARISYLKDYFSGFALNDLYTSFATGKFCLAYYLLYLRAYYPSIFPQQSLSESSKLMSLAWSLNFDSLSQDLLILELLSRIYPDLPLYDAIVQANKKGLKSHIFFHSDSFEDPINISNQGRFLAQLLAMFNSKTGQKKIKFESMCITSRSMTSAAQPQEEEELKKEESIKVEDDQKKEEEAKVIGKSGGPKKKAKQAFGNIETNGVEKELPEPRDLSRFTEIMKAYARASEAHNKKYMEQTETVELTSLASMFQLIQTALIQYNQGIGQKKNEFKGYFNSLGTYPILFKEENMIESSQSDDDLYNACLELADFENIIYQHYFAFKFNFDMKLQPKTDYRFYPKTIALCEAISFELYSLIDSLINRYKSSLKKECTFAPFGYVQYILQDQPLTINVTNNANGEFEVVLYDKEQCEQFIQQAIAHFEQAEKSMYEESQIDKEQEQQENTILE